MAVVNDNDKMRDIIAAAAADLEGDPADAAPVEGAEGAEGEEHADGGDGGDGQEGDGAAGADGAAAAEATDDGGAAEGDGAGAAGDVGGAGKEKPGAEGAAGKTGEAGKAGAAVTPEQKAKQAADAAFAKEHGLKEKDKQGRVNRIPHNIVRDRIVPNAVKKARAEWDATVLKPANDKVRIYEDRLGKIGDTEKIMFEQPRRYLAMLQSIPGYKEIFSEISGGKWVGTAPDGGNGAVGTKLAADKDDPMPTPDAKDDKGNIIGWTQDGIDKRMAWERRQATRDAIAEMEKRNKPMADRFAAVAATEELGANIDNIIGVASAWPGFKENHAAILDVVQKGTEALNSPQKIYKAVQDAYNEVMFGVVGKQKETEEEARKRHFDEFTAAAKKAPRSTATRTTVARHEPTAEQEMVNPDDRMRNIIAESVKKAGLA